MKFLIRRIKPGWIAGTLCGVLFMFLLGVRVGFFENETPRPSAIRKISEKETWMNILQQGQKIGYAHRRFTPQNNGYYLSESVYMRINTMGMVQDIHIQTEGNLHPDFTLASFVFELKSGMFHLKAHGKVEGATLTIVIGEQKAQIPIDNKLYLTAAVLDAAWASGLEPNQARTFLVFDPATMGQRPVRITLVGSETLEIMGQKHNTKKVSLDFMGTSQTVWIGEDGSVVQEEGFLGITIKRVSKNEALSGLDVTASQDLTEIVSVISNVTIERPDKLTRLRLKISGINDRLFLNGGRQTFAKGILTIHKEDIAGLSEFSVSEQEQFLKPSPLIQSNHPHIKSTVSEIVSPGDSPVAKAQKLIAWMYENIKKRPVLSVPNALETLDKRMGDCNEHAVLLAALARAAGIPAQVEAGLVYMKGRFYYHAWNVLYLGRWITADALMGQLPADVTHIRFVRGEPKQQIDLIGVIGKVRIEILEESK